MDERLRKEGIIIVLITLLSFFAFSTGSATDKGESPENTKSDTRGIGGTKPGASTGHISDQKAYILNAIEQGYDESYSALVAEFLRAADMMGKSAATYTEMNVEVDVLKEVSQGGRSQAVAVTDGDTLTGNDNYKIQFRCSTECYIYIAQLDSTGKLDPIFPGEFSPRGNPVSPHTLYSVPTGNNWFYLDENTGRETIYVIASRTRRSDIDGVFLKLSQKGGTLAQRTPVSLENSYVLSRGIGGTRKGGNQNVGFQDGTQGNYSTTLFSTEGGDFVMTLWFHHR